jgi:hypothetical protein
MRVDAPRRGGDVIITSHRTVNIMRMNRISPLVAAAALMVAGAGHAGAQTVTCTGSSDPCQEVRTFTASVVDFRTSERSGSRYVSITLRLQNRTAAPIILGYVNRSGLVVDNEGNRYNAAGEVRGIGLISGNTFDPKFTLQPGERGDARFEFTWWDRSKIAGTRFDFDLALREIEPVAGRQFRLGKEHALQFQGLGEPEATVAATEAPAATATQPVAPYVDPCAGLERCFSSGPIVTEVTQVTTSKQSGYQGVRLTLRIRNVSAEPVILAYKSRSGQVIDDRGNRFANEGSRTDRVHGIGLVTNRSADPQFVLRPGEARTASFENTLGIYRNTVLGTVYSYDLVLEQLEVLPSNQVRSLREFAIGFQNLQPSTGDAASATGQDAANKLFDAIRKAATKKP